MYKTILIRMTEEKWQEILNLRMAYIVSKKEDINKNDWYNFLLDMGIDSQLEEYSPEDMYD